MKFYKIITVAFPVLLLTGCQGRTTDNVEPTGDTVEVTPSTPTERADTVLHSMDEEMLHGLDNEVVMATRV